MKAQTHTISAIISTTANGSKVPDLFTRLTAALLGSGNGMTSKPALEELRKKLVNNYVQQRDELLDSSLPEVSSIRLQDGLSPDYCYIHMGADPRGMR